MKKRHSPEQILRSGLRPSLRLSIRSHHPRFSHNKWTKEPEGVTPPASEKKTKAKPKKTKHDPQLMAAARELRDRWLDRVSAQPDILTVDGKYDVARRLESSPSAVEVNTRPQDAGPQRLLNLGEYSNQRDTEIEHRAA